ncbi:hypothetical protein WJX74_002007 [Apatococcus lobatus]|uniref:Chloride channel protein n=1 Tax=Apatococcus lobatus TaxID=904363 RepID=A0AAW1QLE1_9CHLO
MRPTRLLRETESLDFEPVHNSIFQEQTKARSTRKRFYGYTGHTAARGFVVVFCGIITGLLAAGLSTADEKLITLKLKLIDLLQSSGYNSWQIFAVHLAWSMPLLIMASSSTPRQQRVGGVSLVMAYLNGNDVPDLLRGRTLIVKWLGTMCGVTAGLAVGPEAPMVHMGACVASLLAFLDFGGPPPTPPPFPPGSSPYATVLPALPSGTDRRGLSLGWLAAVFSGI